MTWPKMNEALSSSSPPSIPVRPPAGLLIITDEPEVLRALERDLESRSYEMVVTDSPTMALEILELQSIGVVLSAYLLPEMNGVSFLDVVRSRWPRVQRLLMATIDELPTMSGAQPIFRLLCKPWNREELKTVIDDAFSTYALLHENAELWALAQRQYHDLHALNHSLETKISKRTQQLVSAKVAWEKTFDAIVDPLAIVSGDYVVLRANLAYADHANKKVAEVPGLKCFELVAARSSPCLSCPLNDEDTAEANRGADIAARDNKTLHVWSFPMTSKQAQNVCYYRNVTEERELEHRLIQTEKLASIGLFVGGVAHEVNGPLGNITALAEALKDNYSGSAEDLELVHDIQSSAERCRRIIDSLRSFARGSAQLYRERIQVDEVVAEVVHSFERDYGSQDCVQIHCDIRGDIPPIRGDVALLHQLFRNLLQNAFHSLHKEAGHIDFLIQEESQSDSGAESSCVLVVVSDNGSGISPENLKQVFQPFFTTKSETKMGTGLGLSISHQIVQKHRGSITVESEEGKGTSFRIVLPLGDATGSYRLADLEPKP
jgi:two-component system NtrC family sensor kinase